MKSLPFDVLRQSVDNDDVISSDINSDICFSCRKPIKERHLLKVRGFHRPWHVRCLRCSVCQVPLDREASCFYRGRNIYCRTDYIGYRCAHFNKTFGYGRQNARHHVVQCSHTYYAYAECCVLNYLLTHLSGKHHSVCATPTPLCPQPTKSACNPSVWPITVVQHH